MKKLTLIVILLGLFFIASSAWATIYNRNLIENGDFEDDLNKWSCSCNSWDVKDDWPHDGNYYLSLGNYNCSEAIAQNITLPDDAGKINLNFYLDFNTEDITDERGTDSFRVQVRDVYTNEYYVNDYRFPTDGITYGWTAQSYDLTSAKGRMVDVMFAVENDDTLFTWACCKMNK